VPACPSKKTSRARTGRSCWFPPGARGFFPPSLGGRSDSVSDGQANRHANRKSEESVVPTKRSNTAGTPAAEIVEGRESPERNAPRSCPSRTQSRTRRGIGRWSARLVASPQARDSHPQGRSRRREFFTDRSVRGPPARAAPTAIVELCRRTARKLLRRLVTQRLTGIAPAVQ
jgi:hypothetical protein